MVICLMVQRSYNLSKTAFTNHFQDFIPVAYVIVQNLQIKKIACVSFKTQYNFAIQLNVA